MTFKEREEELKIKLLEARIADREAATQKKLSTPARKARGPLDNLGSRFANKFINRVMSKIIKSILK